MGLEGGVTYAAAELRSAMVTMSAVKRRDCVKIVREEDRKEG